jgi:hypothetical protein
MTCSADSPSLDAEKAGVEPGRLVQAGYLRGTNAECRSWESSLGERIPGRSPESVF